MRFRTMHLVAFLLLDTVLAQYGVNASWIELFPEISCTKNEWPCQARKTCIDYNNLCSSPTDIQNLGCYVDSIGPCAVYNTPFTNATKCPDGTKGKTFMLGQGATFSRCICPNGTVWNPESKVCQAVDRCSESVKDRFCDQKCNVSGSSVTCECYQGFHQDIKNQGPLTYTACAPDVSQNNRLILNGLFPKSDWTFDPDRLFTNKTDILFLNSTLVIPRINIRPSNLQYKIPAVYGITEKDGQNFLTQYNERLVAMPSKPLLYKLALMDFAMDWPRGNVYYLSRTEPKLIVCNYNNNNNKCRILQPSYYLTTPTEMVADVQSGYLFVLDGSLLWRISLDGIKALKVQLPHSHVKYLTLDYYNFHLFYYNTDDSSVYRFNYSSFGGQTQPQKLFRITFKNDLISDGPGSMKLTAMTAIGSQLYLSVTRRSPMADESTQIFQAVSSNPYFTPQKPSVLTTIAGAVHCIYIHHDAQVQFGLPTSAGNCHLWLGNTCVCMEGFKLVNGNCVKELVKQTNATYLLYTSPYRQLILSQQVLNSDSCELPGLDYVPLSPIQHIGSAIQDIGYDYVKGVIYYTAGFSVWRRAADNESIAAEDTGLTAVVGWYVSGLAINPRLRTMYLLYHNTVSGLHVIMVSLDNFKKTLTYPLGSTFDYDVHAAKSVKVGLNEYNLVIEMTSVPPIVGFSMSQAVTFDVNSGKVYTLDSVYQGRLQQGNEKLGNESFSSISYGSDGLIFLSKPDCLGSYNLNGSSLNCCKNNPMRNVRYIEVNLTLSPMPSECFNCSGLCIHTSMTNYTCACTNGQTSMGNGKCSTPEVSVVCSQGQLKCPTRDTCINLNQLCNGKADCELSADESPLVCNQTVSCQTGMVKCNSTSAGGRCIPSKLICDGINDCTDAEDEKVCLVHNITCRGFRCPESGVCLPMTSKCNGVADCPMSIYDEFYCTSCSNGYKCKGLRSMCIQNVMICDGHADCELGDDELNCTQNILRSCGDNSFRCSNGQCIPSLWQCDGHSDCADSSDEHMCDRNHCATSHIRCNNTGQCILPNWKCDKQQDCLGGEDEINCDTVCQYDEFKCQDRNNVSICIDIIKVCDRYPDCQKNLDESSNCNSNVCLSAPCSHDCIVNPTTPNSYWCVCPQGMHLISDHICVPDERSCDQWGVCSQLCQSRFTDGTIKCTCLPGYTIEPDEYSCKHNDGPAHLIFSNRHDLRLLPTEPSPQFSVLISSLRNTIAVDFHYAKNYVFWSDVIADKIYRGTRDNGSSGILYDVIEIVSSGLPTAEGLAVDWIGDHIYWVESGLDIIEVADLDGKNRSTIISSTLNNSMENPRSIAIDPRDGLLFWADWGIKQIRRATMAGGDQKKIFTVNDPKYIPHGGWANGLTIDYDMRRIYWIDAKSDTIQTIDYDGTDFRLVLAENELLKHPFAISVFGNWVYWSDWRTNSVNRANKWNGTKAELVQSTFTQPFDLKVYHPGRQPSLDEGTKDLCSKNNNGCSHICLRVNKTDVECACPHLMIINTDGKTCIDIGSFMLLSTSSYLTSMSLTSESQHGVMPTLAPPLIEKVYMADYYEVENDTDRRIFWADSGLKAIGTADFEGSKPRSILDLSTGIEYRFAIDHVSKRIYISTYSIKFGNLGTIDICLFDGSKRTTITRGLSRPKSIVVQPDKGLMYVVDEGDVAVYKLYMNGSFFSGNKSSSNIISGLLGISTVKNFRLVLAEENNSILYFGNSSHIFKYNGVSTPEAIRTSVNDYGTWTILSVGSNDTIVYTVKLNETEGFKVISADLNFEYGTIKGSSVLDIKIVNRKKVLDSQRPTCIQCTHHCLPSGDPKLPGTCVCYAGYRRRNNKCEALSDLVIYSVRAPYQGIFAVDLTNSSSGGLAPFPQVYKPVSVEYLSKSLADADHDYIYWIDSGQSIVRSKRDLTDRQTVISGLIAARDLAIDSESENMYWVDSFTGCVEVARVDGSQRYILYQQDDSKPTAVSVHPSKGYLFIIDADKGIKRLHLGTNTVKAIVNSSVELSALVVDWQKHLVYFCNSSGRAIHSMDLDGNLLHEYALLSDLSQTSLECVGLAVNENHLYYVLNTGSSTEVAQIWHLDLNYTTHNATKVQGVNGSITDVILTSKSRFSVLDSNPCSLLNDYGSCQSLCLFDGDRTPVSHCFCALGTLDPKAKKDCLDPEDFLIFSKVNGIEFSRVSYNDSLTSAPYKSISNERTLNVIALAADPVSSKIFYSDIQRKTISWIFYNGSQSGDIVTGLEPVEGLAFVDGMLYYTIQSSSDSQLPSINIVDPQSFKVKTLVSLKKYDAPRAIAVHSCTGFMFWTNWNEASPSIQRAETTGAHVTSIITKNIIIPNGLTLDYQQEKLYWADANLDKIERCDFDGRNCIVFLDQVSPHIFALALHGDFLYWTDWMQRAVRMAHKLDGSFNKTLAARLPRQPMGITIASIPTCTVSPCHNSGCLQKCTVTENGTRYMCSCFEGYNISPTDSKACVLSGDCSDGFSCGVDCIPWELTCDGRHDCHRSHSALSSSPDEEPVFCATRTCPSNNYITCRNQHCVAHARQCDGVDDCGDLSDELDCMLNCNITSQFKCSNGQCIPLRNRCDGVPHCWDKSDELPPNCTTTQSIFINCSVFDHPFYGRHTDGVKCENTPVCILESWKCDGQNDCWDNSDELNCNKPKNCSVADEWACDGDNLSTRQCILASWRCDGEPDCTDGSDEKNCATCPPGQFNCREQRTCVPQEWKCDGNRDCPDGSDEDGCTSVKPLQCSPSQYNCSDGSRCIPLGFLCDGDPDCNDSSDESPAQGCIPTECARNEMRCDNGRCIDRTFVCDRFNDCLDHSDEPDSCNYRVCDLSSEFTCTNRSECVPLTSRCDGWMDCSDGSDEDKKNCPDAPQSVCPSEEWQCPDGHCIHESKLCDSIQDCSGYADEIGCDVNECMETNGGCNQLCVDDKVGHHCTCFQGYKLSRDNRTCEDINECVVNVPCSQRCVNIPSRYYCTCANGFSLASDKSSCKATSGLAPYLLLANRYYIRNLTLDYISSSNESTQSLVSKNVTNAVGLDFDWKAQKIYWTDVTNDRHTISRMAFDGSNSEMLHSTSVQHPDGLAVDWVGGNLYWCDNILNTIEVSKLDGKYKKVLKRGINEPRALQLYPVKGYLFYTDWGTQAHIGRMGMDGSGYRVILSENLGWPNALAIDLHSENLYFGDAKLNYIAMIDIDGNNKRMILTSGVNHIYSMAVFENSIYWSEWNYKQIHKAHKHTGANAKVLVQLIHRPMDIRVVHELNQPVKRDNPCEGMGCTGLCLLRPTAEGVAQATCACPEYHTLLTDNRTCLPNCSIAQFQCNNDMQCLHFTQKCDGSKDCYDGSDEMDCTGPKSNCPPFKFPCNSQPEHLMCLDADKICNGLRECHDGADEKVFNNCTDYTCLSGSYLCHDGHSYVCTKDAEICEKLTQNYRCPTFNDSICATTAIGCQPSGFLCSDKSKCIPYVFQCDGEMDCPDKSDEDNATCSNNQCQAGYFSCNSNGQCIPDSWLCDGTRDCRNGHDETDEFCVNSTCPELYFQCKDKKCIIARWVCDEELDCLDGSDEVNCTARGCTESEWQCIADRKCVRKSQLCDGRTDCIDSSDEYNCNANKTCSADEFKCMNAAGHCIPLSWRCDNTPDCPDQSDEKECTDRQCGQGMFKCVNSLCIPSTFKCDGQNDCLDGTDETLSLCEKNICLPDRFRCGNHKCIPVNLLCDGKDDCNDNSDENARNCPNLCKDKESFQCPDGSCVAKEKKCNGVVDCPYKPGSNADCNEGNCDMSPNDERNAEYYCTVVSGGCENYFGYNHMIATYLSTFLKKNTNCYRAKCTNVQNSITNLTCEKGFEINWKHQDFCSMCVDKNECTQYGSCAQICDNTIGGFNCSCQAGFRLIHNKNSNGVMHDCVLEDEDSPHLLIASANSLRSFDLTPHNKENPNERPSFISYVNSTSRIDSLAVNTYTEPWMVYMLSYHTKSIVSADISTLKGNSRRKRAITATVAWQQHSKAAKSQTMNLPTTIKSGLGNLSSIAFDWRHNTLYWTDYSNATVTIFNLDTYLESDIITVKSLLDAISDRHFRPLAITVDPVVSARVFWTDCCVKPRIWSADLDGSSPRVLTDQVAWLSGITCDVSNQRLYWTDAKHMTLNTITVHGQDQRIVHVFKAFQPNLIDVFGRLLMITSLNRSSIVMLDKFSGLLPNKSDSFMTTILQSDDLHISDIKFVHSRKHYTPTASGPVKCDCGPNTIVTETYHEDNLRCSCVCPKGSRRINETHCYFCPCLNGGVCANKPDANTVCNCPAGFGGELCQLNLCDSYCYSGSTCEVLDGQPHCLCPLHLAGPRCNTSKCNNMTCGNGVCQIDDGGITYCHCQAGYTGSQCQTFMPGCTRCGNRSTDCIRYPDDTYECKCKSGYSGVDCQNCFNGSMSILACNGNGYCTYDTQGQPSCNCYYNNLNPNSGCIKSLCKDVCKNGGLCSIVNDSTGNMTTQCDCPPYFMGKYCEKRAKCNNVFCKNGGTCIENSVNSKTQPAICVCTPDFAGEICDFQCKDGCPEDYECILLNGEPVCSCQISKYGNHCEYAKACRNHCFNGGTCQHCFSNMSISDCSTCCDCRCPDGWAGSRCENRSPKITTSAASVSSTVGVVIAVVTCLVLLAAFVVGILFYKRHRRRQQLFAHLRLREDRNTVEVSNPMYMKAGADGDEELDEDGFSVYSTSDTSAFANPFFKLTSSSRKAKDSGERSLLLSDESTENM